MSVPVIAFFNNQGGVGTTSIVYHLAWMFADLQVRVLAVDLDPQADLTRAFRGPTEGFGVLRVDRAHSLGQVVSEGLILLSSDLMLSAIEEPLAREWEQAGSGDVFGSLAPRLQELKELAEVNETQVVLMDLGPNLGAINRAGLIVADHLVVPVAPDVSSAAGLQVLGAQLRKWRADWHERLDVSPQGGAGLPSGNLSPLGYLLRRQGVLVGGGEERIDWIPGAFREFVLGVSPEPGVSVFNDPENLAILRPYRSLMPMAQEAHKPMFHLKPADGAIGAHLQSAEDARKDFDALARAIVAKAKLPITFAS